MSTATVKLWGTTIGYVAMGPEERFARFEYDPDFADLAVEPAPIHMPVRPGQIYQFPDLHPRSFHGMPGMIADSLPDKYGQRLINVWLARTGRKPEDFNSVDRLCYTGRRGMGALEFEPSKRPEMPDDKQLEIEQLTQLASMAFASKETLDRKFAEVGGEEALLDILSVSTSAGGARAKAVIAFNPETKHVRSGQIDLPEGVRVQALIDESQKHVTGTVRLKLYKGHVRTVGRWSDHSLYSEAHVTFEDDAGAYDQKDAQGFIQLNALRLKLLAAREKRLKR